MKKTHNNILKQNKNLALIAGGTGVLLLIPLVLQLTIGTGTNGQGFNWHLFDFVVAGTLLFSAGSLFVLATQKIAKKYHIVLGIVLLIAFLWLWAELAVGIFTNLGS